MLDIGFANISLTAVLLKNDMSISFIRLTNDRFELRSDAAIGYVIESQLKYSKNMPFRL